MDYMSSRFNEHKKENFLPDWFAEVTAPLECTDTVNRNERVDIKNVRLKAQIKLNQYTIRIKFLIKNTRETILFCCK